MTVETKAKPDLTKPEERETCCMKSGEDFCDELRKSWKLNTVGR